MVKKGKKVPHKGGNITKKNKNFKEGDLVAAKVKGHSIWPGRIETIDEIRNRSRYIVKFFGTNESSSKLQADAIIPFGDFTPKLESFKRKHFKEAFEECQEEFNSRPVAKKGRQGQSSPAPSLETAFSEAQSVQSGAHSAPSEPSTIPKTSASPEPPEPLVLPTEASAASSEDGPSLPAVPDTLCQANDTSIKIENTDNIDDEKKKKKKSNEPKRSSVRVKVERVSPQKSKRKVVRQSPTRLDTRIDNNCEVLPKVEIDDPKSRDLTIRKLRSKIEKKLEEKARMKQEEREKRTLHKSSETLIRINRQLTKFLNASKLLDITMKENQFTPLVFTEWELALKRFESIHKALITCISNLSEKRPSHDLKNCRDILYGVVTILASAKKNDKLPQFTQDKIKLAYRLTRRNQSIKALINRSDDFFEKQENAMIERKENSVNN